MILVVDTYNVLHVVGILPPELAGVDVAGLVRLIEASRYSASRVELICDGTPSPDPVPARQGRIRVRYSGAGRQADDLIAALVADSSAPKRLTVVSSDQWVMRQARRRRCRTMSADRFLTQLADDAAATGVRIQPARPQGMLPGSEVARWLDIFRIKPSETAPQPPGPPEPSQPVQDKTEAPPPELPPEPPPELPPQSPPHLSPQRPPASSPPSKSPEKRRKSRDAMPARQKAGDHGPIPQDVIEQAERIWAERAPE